MFLANTIIVKLSVSLLTLTRTFIIPSFSRLRPRGCYVTGSEVRPSSLSYARKALQRSHQRPSEEWPRSVSTIIPHWDMGLWNANALERERARTYLVRRYGAARHRPFHARLFLLR